MGNFGVKERLWFAARGVYGFVDGIFAYFFFKRFHLSWLHGPTRVARREAKQAFKLLKQPAEGQVVGF